LMIQMSFGSSGACCSTASKTGGSPSDLYSAMRTRFWVYLQCCPRHSNSCMHRRFQVCLELSEACVESSRSASSYMRHALTVPGLPHRISKACKCLHAQKFSS
jgi:hypothetical protein